MAATSCGQALPLSLRILARREMFQIMLPGGAMRTVGHDRSGPELPRLPPHARPPAGQDGRRGRKQHRSTVAELGDRHAVVRP